MSLPRLFDAFTQRHALQDILSVLGDFPEKIKAWSLNKAPTPRRTGVDDYPSPIRHLFPPFAYPDKIGFFFLSSETDLVCVTALKPNFPFMKKLFLSLLVLGSIFGCKEDADPVHSIVGNWDLVSIENSWTGGVQTGTALSYRQSYQFRKDGTFTKTKNAEDQVLEATGSYSTFPQDIASSADVKLNVVMDFTDGDELAGDCGGSTGELLVLRNNNQLVNTWGMCDGPRLTYEKN